MNAHTTSTIMIVDDIPANLALLDELLHRQGYRVLQFPRGDLALRAIDIVCPDLILLDLMMPGMHGFEVCRRLKTNARTKEIPLIFISALDDLDSKVRAFAKGAADYVTKPFQEAEVLARVRTHLALRALRLELQTQRTNLECMVERRTHELNEALTRVQRLDKLKDDFLRMISHEIGTPANGVLGVGELLMDLCPDSEDCRHYRALFRQASQRLHGLIEDTMRLAELASASMLSDEPSSSPRDVA